MMRLISWFAVLASLSFPSPAIAVHDAQHHCTLPPGYYRVAPAAAGSGLALRSTPALEALRIGQLERSDIVFSDGGRVRSGETVWQSVRLMQTEGWIDRRNLWRTLPLTLGESAIPAAGRCGDVQPLWGVSWSGGEFRLSLYPGKHVLAETSVQSGKTPGTALVNGENAEATMNFIYTDQVCSDPQGKAIGWGQAHVVVRDAEGVRLFSGCCQASREAFASK